jgi:hypothetical protein
MMVQKEDLGLSLSLSFPQTHHSLQQNLMPCLLPSSASSSSPPPPLSSFNLPKPTWNDAFLSSGSFMGFFLFAWLSLSDLVGAVAGFSHCQPFS